MTDPIDASLADPELEIAGHLLDHLEREVVAHLELFASERPDVAFWAPPVAWALDTGAEAVSAALRAGQDARELSGTPQGRLTRLEIPSNRRRRADLRLRLSDVRIPARAAYRAMGMMGMAGRFAVEVAVYERRVRTPAELEALRQALGQLAHHLAEARAAARDGVREAAE